MFAMNLVPDFVQEIFTAKGPDFLWFYAGFYVLLCVGVWFLLRWLDASRKLPPLAVPEEPPNPYEFAALRAGRHEIVRMFLLELFSNGLLKLTRNKGKVTKQSKLRRTNKPMEDVPDLSPEGRTFLDWFQSERDAASVFTSSPLGSLAKQWATNFNSRFEEDRLVLSQCAQTKVWLVLLCAIVLFLGVGFILGVGIVKWTVDFKTGHHHIFFLVGSMLVGGIVMLLCLQPRRLSQRGKQYIKAVQKKFRPAKMTRNNAHNNVSQTLDLLFDVGLRGISILNSTDLASFAKFFRKAGSDGGGCGGGCSSGCGGCGD